jgi:hypothetical protein
MKSNRSRGFRIAEKQNKKIYRRYIDKRYTLYTIHAMEKPIYEYSAEKNLKLLREREIGFEDIIALLDSKGPLGVINHPNKTKYPHQKIYIVDINGYVYLVPFEKHGSKAILKTIYPSRKMTRLYHNKLSGEK